MHSGPSSNHLLSSMLNLVALCLTHSAGHYVPATGQVIVDSRSIYAKNLKGIAIGNGWVDPYVQYEAYAQVCI